jgi:hypothetical protein
VVGEPRRAYSSESPQISREAGSRSQWFKVGRHPEMMRGLMLRNSTSSPAVRRLSERTS